MYQQDLLRALDHSFFSQIGNDVNFLSNWLFFPHLLQLLVNGSPHIQLPSFSIFQKFLFDILTYHTDIGCMNSYWRGRGG